MSKITAICCVAVLLALLLPIINGSTDVAIQDNPRFQRVQRMFREISVNRTIPAEKIFWNPQILYDCKQNKMKSVQIHFILFKHEFYF